MMQQDENHINNPDDFSREVREKLRKHQIPVRSAVWDALSGKLPTVKKRIPAYWLWGVAGAASVVLVLVLVLFPVNDKHTVEVMQHEESFVSDSTPEKSDIRKEDEPDIKQIVVEKTTEIEKKAVSPERNGDLAQVDIKEKSLDLEKRQKWEDAKVQDEIVIAEKIENSEEAVQSETEIPEIGVPHDGNIKTEEFIVENIPVKKIDKLQSLTGAFGSGGSLPDFSFSGLDMNDPQYTESLPGGIVTDENGLVSGGDYHLLSPNDYTNIEHRIPVTFSLTTDFQIAQRLSVETGLSYTYLFSRFTRNDQLIYRGTLQQHYLGIPVNLRFTIWQNDAWTIYLMGGGNVEKGLRAIYKQEIEQNGAVVFHTNVYSRIKGFQVSAQSGAGFSYRLNKNINLFGEPRFIYYFKNNQPMSARTENPLIFGLNLGIRLRFNSE